MSDTIIRVALPVQRNFLNRTLVDEAGPGDYDALALCTDLEQKGIVYIGDVIQLSEHEFFAMVHGRAGADAILARLAAMNFRFGTKAMGWRRPGGNARTWRVS
jgi:hypothetical protein